MGIAIPFRSIQHVYFDDLDALNILHNVRYLLFIERARGEFFNALGFHWKAAAAQAVDTYHVIAEHQIRYLVPVRGEGDLEVDLIPTHLGTSSLVIKARVCNVGSTIVHSECTTRLVRLDPTTNRPCPWSDRFRGLVQHLVRPA